MVLFYVTMDMFGCCTISNNKRHWVLLKYSTKAFDNGLISVFADKLLCIRMTYHTSVVGRGYILQ